MLCFTLELLVIAFYLFPQPIIVLHIYTSPCTNFHLVTDSNLKGYGQGMSSKMCCYVMTAWAVRSPGDARLTD